MTNLNLIDAIHRHEKLRPSTACPSCGEEAACIPDPGWPSDTIAWECMNDECEKIRIENNEYNKWEQEMQNLYYELSINESDVVTRYNY